MSSKIRDIGSPGERIDYPDPTKNLVFTSDESLKASEHINAVFEELIGTLGTIPILHKYTIELLGREVFSDERVARITEIQEEIEFLEKYIEVGNTEGKIPDEEALLLRATLKRLTRRKNLIWNHYKALEKAFKTEVPSDASPTKKTRPFEILYVANKTHRIFHAALKTPLGVDLIRKKVTKDRSNGKLGQGAFGAVVEKEIQMDTGERVVVAQKTSHDDGLSPLEFGAMASVDPRSESIVTPLFASMEDEESMIGMERAVSDLASLRKKRKATSTLWKESELIDLASTILRSIKELRNTGLVHHDIKLQNILVFKKRLGDGSEKLVFRVCDLGCVAPIGNKKMAGTISYMPQEKLRELPSNEKADLWSMGVTLVEMLLVDTNSSFGKDLYLELNPEILEKKIQKKLKSLEESGVLLTKSNILEIKEDCKKEFKKSIGQMQLGYMLASLEEKDQKYIDNFLIELVKETPYSKGLLELLLALLRIESTERPSLVELEKRLEYLERSESLEETERYPDKEIVFPAGKEVPIVKLAEDLESKEKEVTYKKDDSIEDVEDLVGSVDSLDDSLDIKTVKGVLDESVAEEVEEELALCDGYE